MYYYFDIITKVEDLILILIDKKSFKNILIYVFSYETLIGKNPLRIRLDKVNKFIRIYDGTRYLVLLIPKKVLSLDQFLIKTKICIVMIYS